MVEPDRLRCRLPGTAGSRLRAGLTAALLYLVRSNAFISLSATSVAVSTSLLVGLPLEPAPLFIVFGVTLFVYSFNRVTDLPEDEHNVPERASFVRRYGTAMLAAGTLLYAGAVGFALLGDVPGAPGMVLPLLVAVLYSVFRAKRVFLVKNLLVGAAWAAIPLGVGVYHGRFPDDGILFVAAFVGLMITIAAAVFDIKDIEGDRAEDIRTVPTLFGPQRTRQFAAGATALVAGGVVAAILAGPLPERYGLLLVFSGYVFGYSLVAREEWGPLFYGFVVDGEHVFLAAVLLAREFLLSGV